jgi:hypothetical protein
LDVAALFEPCLEAICDGIQQQLSATRLPITVSNAARS